MSREPFVKLAPVFKDYLWGGETLKLLYGAAEPRVAEAWLLSAHPHGPSIVAEGRCTGMTFPQYLLSEEGQSAFPVLIKLIDAAQKLSVQVHPDEAYAQIHENDHGKNEMWVVLEAKEDAYLYIGFNRDVSKGEIRTRVTDGTIETVLRKVPTRPGDIYYIPAGTVHAIGAGNLILEVQQSSNATYRLYDYQRRDAQGALRPLHLNKALDVLDGRNADSTAQTRGFQSMRCPYFSVEYCTVSVNRTIPISDGRIAAIVCVGGEGTLTRQRKSTALHKGDAVYLPTGADPAECSGEMQLIVTRAAYSD